MVRSVRSSIPLVGVLIAFLAASLVAYAQPAPPGVPLAVGLTSPRGLSVDGTSILVAEVGTGRVLRIAADGEVSVAASGLPTTSFFSEETGTQEAAGPSAAIAMPGGIAVTVSEAPGDTFQSVYFVAQDGSIILVADLGAYERDNNTDDDVDIEGNPEFLSNPYDLLSDGAGGLFVSNSGANAILHIAADGTISPYAVFPNRDNPLFPNVGGPTMDQVPTGIAYGPDGALYVGTLTGFPFAPSQALVYRLSDDNADGDALDEGEATVFASGLTSVTDVAFDVDGSLLVTQFSASMLEEAPGQVVRVTAAGNEVVVDGLITPTALVVTADGRIVVSQEFAGLVSDVSSAPGEAPAPGPADTGGYGAATSEAPQAIALLALAVAVLLGARGLTRAHAR